MLLTIFSKSFNYYLNKLRKSIRGKEWFENDEKLVELLFN